MKTKNILKYLIFTVICITASSLNAATSQENRQDSLVYVGLTPFGVHVPSILTRPLNVGVYLGSRFMVGAEYGKVQNSDYEHAYLEKKYEGEDAGEQTNVTGSFTNEGVYARLFTEESSLNLYLGYHVRTWEGEGTLTRDSGEAKGDMKFQARVGSIGIGNRWQFDSGLTIGIDWYVDSRILEQSLEYEITSNTGIPEDEVKTEVEDFGNFLNAVSGLPGLCVVTFGLSF